MAQFDVPAIIDHVLAITGSPYLNYVGHSMGCLCIFAAISHHPHYSKKIKKMAAIAPSLYAENISNFFLKVGVAFGYSVVSENRF